MRKMNPVQKIFSVDEMKQLYGVVEDQDLLKKIDGVNSKGAISTWRSKGIPAKIELQVRKEFPAYFIRREMDDLTVKMLDKWERMTESQKYSLLGMAAGIEAESPPLEKPKPPPDAKDSIGKAA